jgi:hypothetical protein
MGQILHGSARTTEGEGRSHAGGMASSEAVERYNIVKRA